MVFTRFVEVGRVAVVNYGKLKDSLVVIVNVVDQNRVQIDGPTTGVARQLIKNTRLTLTDIVIKVPFNVKQKELKKAIAEANVEEQFKASSLGKLIAQRNARHSMNDFDRFKVMVAKRVRNKAIKKKLAELRK
mmetsp:Transcript_8284/g.14663  ORF Transcript_8284/g.14663 Transcript_8284/m.14663 type:complete len:133 (+) Transcript_8284:110-508(+)